MVAIAAVVAASTTCAAASLPMAAGAVSSAGAPSALPDAAVAATPREPSRLRLRGQKWIAPQLQRSEAGLTWSFTPKVTLELNYERSAMAPTMPHDHDDGFLTRLKLGF